MKYYYNLLAAIGILGLPRHIADKKIEKAIIEEKLFFDNINGHISFQVGQDTNWDEHPKYFHSSWGWNGNEYGAFSALCSRCQGILDTIKKKKIKIISFEVGRDYKIQAPDWIVIGKLVSTKETITNELERRWKKIKDNRQSDGFRIVCNEEVKEIRSKYAIFLLENGEEVELMIERPIPPRRRFLEWDDDPKSPYTEKEIIIVEQSCDYNFYVSANDLE